MDDSVARERVARVEHLLEDVESLPDERAQETATALTQALLDLYGEGLARIVSVLAARDDDGALAAAVAGDELVSHLLLLHDLHPLGLEERVRGALADVRPYLESHGGDVELLGVTDEGVARLRLQGSCEGCPSSAATLQLAIEEAIHSSAPDVVRVEAEGAVAPAKQNGAALLQIKPLPEPAAKPHRSWSVAGGLPELQLGSTLVREVDGEPVLFLRLERRTYAYRPLCPQCGGALGDAPLAGTQLTCPDCTARYDVRRAGRCLDDPHVHLDPLPLLVDGEGRVKIALGSAA